MSAADVHSPARDAERLVAWLREAADELEKAHALLDEFGVPRVRAESGLAMTLAARVSTLQGAGRASAAGMNVSQERAEEIIRALQPLASDDQVCALARQLRRMLDRAANLEPYPGPHAGTGANDHPVHHWQEYAYQGRVIRACQMCGVPHPDDRGKS